MVPSLKLAVGIDIGVSTSGASFSLLGPDDRPSDVVQSINLRGNALQPTAIGSQSREDSWGKDIKAELGETKLDLLKLALAEGALPHGTLHSDRLAVAEKAHQRIEDAGLDGVSAMTIYLRRFWKTCEEELRTHLRSRKHLPADLAALHIRFGIPAVWNELITGRMKDAIEQSGMLSFTNGPRATMAFISEPEAAAFAVIPRLAAKHNPEDGNTVMIADFGGGTVDVVSYTLASTETGDVDECVPGEGALLGDMYMKDALLSLIKRDAQSYADVDNIEELDSTKFQAEFDNFWREACRTPAGTGRDTEVNDFKIQGADGKYYLPFPVLRSDVVQKFRTVTDDIMSLMRRQIEGIIKKQGSAPNLIIVIGGFGCNRFLQAELRTQFPGLRFAFQDEPGQMAIKDGAAISAAATFDNSKSPLPAPGKHPIRVNSHIPSHSYGFWSGKGPSKDIWWAINKGLPVSTDSNKCDIKLDPKAFEIMMDDHCPCVPIHRVGKQTPEVASRREVKSSTRFCHVKYLGAGTMAQYEGQLLLGVEIMAGHAKFQVKVAGVVYDDLFEVEF